MKKVLLCVTLLALAPMTAVAADEGPYLLGDFGVGRYENASPFPDPIMLGIGGGYQINRNFAVELGLSIFPEVEATTGGGTAKLRANSLHPAAVGLLPLNPEFSAFGKLGVSSNHAEGANPAGNSFSTSDTDLYFGFGVQYKVNPKLAIRGQYENFGRFSSAPSPLRASAVSVGVAWWLQ
ncbi:MAG TPA: porin family protein [Burkholderiales bacterium]